MVRWNIPHGLCKPRLACCERRKIVICCILNNNNIGECWWGLWWGRVTWVASLCFRWVWFEVLFDGATLGGEFSGLDVQHSNKFFGMIICTSFQKIKHNQVYALYDVNKMLLNFLKNFKLFNKCKIKDFVLKQLNFFNVII